MRDYDSKTTLLHISEEHNKMQDDYARVKESEGSLTMYDRILKHKFSPLFFKLRNLELNLQFHVHSKDKPLREMILIEKHFYEGKMLSEFEFSFQFCMAGSTNTWQYVYQLPQLSEEQQTEMIANPFKT